MNYKILPFLTCLLLSACNSKSSNPKDYWALSEPKIITWEANSGESIPPTVETLSQFRASKIYTTLGYRSYILINNISSEIKFEIKTSCKELMTTESSEKNSPTPQNPKLFTKTSSLEKSNKIYFYNYLPDQILIDSEYKTSASDFICDYEISAINKINSIHTFNIKDIKVNTFDGNFITLNSIETQPAGTNTNESQIVRTINVNKNVVNIELPSLFYNNPQLSYTMKLNSREYGMMEPSFIKCAGESNKIDILNQFREQNPIDILFRLKATDNSTTFLKKCRILALINKKEFLENEASYSIDDLINSDQLLVWSEYFNVIFESPKIEVQTRIVESTTSNYPFNYGIHIDPRTHVFDLIFTNTSNKRTKLHFSETQNIKTLLTPLILISQRPNFRNSDITDIPSTFRMYKTNDNFISGLYLTIDSEPFTEFTLEPNESKTIQIYVSKNFKCELPKASMFHDYPKAEVGFKIQSIPLESSDFNIQASFLNQGQLDKFPESLDLEAMLQQTKNTIFKGTRGEKVIYANHLQVVDKNRVFIIDTVILRNLAGDTKNNYSESFLDQTQYYMFGTKDNPLNIFESFLEPDFGYYLCEQIY